MYPVISLFLSIHWTSFQSIVIDVKSDAVIFKDSGTPLGAKLKESIECFDYIIYHLPAGKVVTSISFEAPGPAWL